MSNKSNIENEIQNAEVQAHEFGASAKRIFKDFKDKAINLQDHATEYVKDGYAKVREKSANVEDKVVTYTRENPLKAIGISLVVGAVVAKLLRSRK